MSQSAESYDLEVREVQPLNIAIVDDLYADRHFLADLISRYCRQNRIVVQTALFESGETFLARFTRGHFDIIFLDIYMNGIDGMQTAKEIRSIDPDCLLVFATTSERHAVSSFRVRAFDYLVKPYSYEQFEEVMRLCDAAFAKQARYIEVKEGRTLQKILLKDIVYTDYYNHYIQIHTKTQVIRTYISFRDFAPLLLKYPQFFCCYRNCIVNMDEVRLLDEKDFVMENGERVPISRSQRNEIRQQYADYIFETLNGGM